MNPEIYEIIGRVLGGIAVIILGWVSERFVAWLKTNTDKATTDKVMTVIDSFVKAADQLYRGKDPDGSIRNEYVKEQLISLGYSITKEINAYIEGAVFNLGHEKS